MSCSTASSTSTSIVDDDDDQKRSFYARVWRFLQRRMHLRPRACSCPVDMKSSATIKTAEDAVASSDWQRDPVWRKLDAYEEGSRDIVDATSTFVGSRSGFWTQAQCKAAQITCRNCGLLFFRPLSGALDASVFCDRDCQSSYEYRRCLQEAVNEFDEDRGPVNWTQSSEL